MAAAGSPGFSGTFLSWPGIEKGAARGFSRQNSLDCFYTTFGRGSPRPSDARNAIIARNRNTFAKRQREMEKKAKAEAKRQRRIRRKQGLEDPASSDGDPADLEANVKEVDDFDDDDDDGGFSLDSGRLPH